MRQRAKVDRNQPEIVDALRRAGASVEFLHQLGKGVPDILAGFRGVNYTMEIKDGLAPKSKQKLTDDEVEWHGKWRGQKSIVTSPEEALKTIGAL